MVHMGFTCGVPGSYGAVVWVCGWEWPRLSLRKLMHYFCTIGVLVFSGRPLWTDRI